jgi:hypothetical protein
VSGERELDGDIPLPIRQRARTVLESEVADALEVLVKRKDIRKGEKDRIPTYARRHE